MHAAIDEDWYWLRQIYLSIEDPVQDWWALIVLPALIGASSITVAIASVRAARSATAIAAKSENARVDAEARRAKDETARYHEANARAYTDRLNDALVRLIQSIGELIEPLELWQAQIERVELHGYTNDEGQLDYPPAPRLHKVRADLDAVRLLARGEDRKVADSIARAFKVYQKREEYRLLTQLQASAELIQEWRSDSASATQTIAYFDSVAATVEGTAG